MMSSFVFQHFLMKRHSIPNAFSIVLWINRLTVFILLFLLQVHTPTGTHDETLEDVLTNHDSTAHNHGNKVTTDTVIATPSKQYANSRLATFANGSLRSSSQSTNCLTSSSATSLNAIFPSTNQFLNNLTRMHQTKIWEEAKCRTFYARDNVCNFIKWSKEFGVNQSVLFESDDLVLHGK